jgi:fermentation-respiration switch protein FrsA (DUF1100 family)
MASPAEAAASATREEVRFDSGGEACAGWLYRPEDAGAEAPCVVLGHGFGALKEGRLDAYAERFAMAGFAALAFDYRHFGESEGEPRRLVSVRRQHRDWEAAIAHARGLEGIDPERIVAWGTSFGGGHAIHAGARDAQIAAVIAQTPFTSGIASVRRLPPGQMAKLTGLGFADLVRALARRPPRYFPTVGRPGELAAMTADDALHGYAAMYPDGFDWGNEVAARSMLAVTQYRPGREAPRVRCPLLVQVGIDDHITPPEPSRRAAARAPRGELVEYEISHFEVYRGEPFERAVADQLEFLRRHNLGR